MYRKYVPRKSTAKLLKTNPKVIFIFYERVETGTRQEP
ncbi:MAG: hypothetical protein ACI8RD_004957 [Bacillariaceae sp.]|jgi:hypothetical protein